MRRRQSISKTCLPCVPAGKATGKTALSAPASPQSKMRGLKRRELEILKAVASLYVATAQDIRLFLGLRSRPYMGELLRELSGGGQRGRGKRRYLSYFGMPHAPGNFRRLYVLTRRGRQALAEHGLEVNSWYNPEKANDYSFSLLSHHRAVSQVIVAITLFVRAYPQFQLVETRPWFVLAGSPPRLPRFTVEGDDTITVIPDAYVYLERHHEDPSKILGFGLWIEVDHGTESKAKFQQFVLDRINFIRSKGYEEYFTVPEVLLVFLAVGATMEYRLRRLHTMRAWTMEVLTNERLEDWATVFKFSTIDETLYDTLMLFTDPVFYQPDSDTLVSLFPPTPE